MVITSRGPANKQEIETCVSTLRASTFGKHPTISWKEFAECWEALLLDGRGHIDIQEVSYTNASSLLKPFLKNPRMMEESPFYKHGFISVIFVCLISFPFVQEICTRTDDSEDPLFTFTRQFRDHLNGTSGYSPALAVDKMGRPTEPCNIYSTSMLHPWIDVWNPLILPLIGPYTNRIIKSIQKVHLGFRHNVMLHTFADSRIASVQASFGNKILREYSTNALAKTPKEKKFITLTAKDATVCESLNVSPDFGLLNTGNAGVFRFLFDSEFRERKAKLTRQRQMICFLLNHGLSDVQISKFVGTNRNGDPFDPEHIPDIYAHCLNKLYEAGYEHLEPHKTRESTRERLQNLLEDSAVAHEFREYVFPSYPWPTDLPSRR